MCWQPRFGRLPNSFGDRFVPISLTSILPALAPILGMTPQALYERQRALIKMGLLPAPQGRGRRDGPVASPEHVALLVIAKLATDHQSDERVRALASAQLTDTRKQGNTRKKALTEGCLWTGARTFHEAVAYLLSSQAPIQPWPKSEAHTGIDVDRSDMTARIFFQWTRRPGDGLSEFGHRDRARNRIKVNAELPFGALQTIRQILNTTTAEGSA